MGRSFRVRARRGNKRRGRKKKRANHGKRPNA
ncbi:50S ribosomal protein bL37 [Streptomyces triticisoli]